MKFTLFAISCFVFVGLTGCNTQPNKSDNKSSPAQSASTTKSVSTVAETTPIELKDVKLADVNEAIKAAKGKIVVLDCWGTWCRPCKAEFHHLVEIHEKYHTQGVVCMSLALNEKDKPGALQFLKTKKATFANYVVPEEEYRVAQDQWNFNGLPAVIVYDTTGKFQAFTRDDEKDQFEYGTHVEPHLKKLLKK